MNLKLTGLAVLLALLTTAAAAAERPNFVFIFADDLGWGDLGVYGHPRIQTPNLDRLARQGVRFLQFYVANPVCSPSRTAIMTGQYPARHRIHGHLAQPERNAARGMPNWLDPDGPMVTRLLQQAGYATAHFGKWHLGGNAPSAPDPGAYGIDRHRTLNSNGPSWQDASDPGFRARSTALFVDEAVRFIEDNRRRPFYVQIWTLLTHATLHPSDEQMEPYKQLGPVGVPYRGANQIYYASATELDRQIGRLLDKLDELNLADNTVVIFSSDNGPEDIAIRNASHSGVGSAGPFRGRKRSLYEGGVRTPFIVRWPRGSAAGKTDRTTVLGGVDFLPTLCSLAGVGLPDGYEPDGEDMSGAWRGRPRMRTKPLMWEWRFRIHGHTLHRSPMLAMRDGNWKLLMNPDRGRVELYDIPSDPSELNNLAREQPKIVERMSRALLAWQETLPPGPRDREASSNAYPSPR